MRTGNASVDLINERANWRSVVLRRMANRLERTRRISRMKKISVSIRLSLAAFPLDEVAEWRNEASSEANEIRCPRTSLWRPIRRPYITTSMAESKAWPACLFFKYFKILPRLFVLSITRSESMTTPNIKKICMPSPTSENHVPTEKQQADVSLVSICPTGEVFSLPSQEDYTEELKRHKILWPSSGGLAGRSWW